MVKAAVYLVTLLLPCSLLQAQIRPDVLLAEKVREADHRLTYGSDPLQFGELRLPTIKGFDSGVISSNSRLRSETMATTLTLDQMKAFVQDHFEEFVNRRNAGVIRKNMTADFADHDGPGGKATGVDGDEQMMLGMYKAMPDLKITIEDMLAEGDKVMCRNIWRWTDPSSGKLLQMHGFVLWRFEGGKIAERWATVTPPGEGSRWARA